MWECLKCTTLLLGLLQPTPLSKCRCMRKRLNVTETLNYQINRNVNLITYLIYLFFVYMKDQRIQKKSLFNRGIVAIITFYLINNTLVIMNFMLFLFCRQMFSVRADGSYLHKTLFNSNTKKLRKQL